MPGPTAIPVKVMNRTLRQLVIEADPEYMVDSENPVEYEFKTKNGTREFRGRYKSRGAYA